MELVDTYVGKMWVHKNNYVSNAIKRGEYEKQPLHILSQYLQPGMVGLDVGANVGLYSVFAAQKIGNGIVYAFEPYPELYSILAKNAELYKNIHPFNFGLWNKEKVFEWYGEKFNVVVGDELLQDVEKVDFIKIDVDGAEVGVLEGLQNLIKRSPKLLMICEFGVKYLIRFGFNGEDFFNLVEKLKLDYGMIAAGGIYFKNNKDKLIETYLKSHCNLLLWKGIKPFWKEK